MIRVHLEPKACGLQLFKTTKQLRSRHSGKMCFQKLHDHIRLQIFIELPTKQILVSQYIKMCQ